MGRSFKIGTAFGIGLYMHWSFLLLPLWVFFSKLWTTGWESGLYCVGLVVSLFACVILHEYGHALTARFFGIPTRDITMFPIGGVARLERMVERPVHELWIAIAGPAVNVVIFSILLPLALLLGCSQNYVSESFVNPGTFLGTLAVFNAVLVFFNMLPAFPMDGGRVLRALLAMVIGKLRATEIAAALGAAMAVVFVLWAISCQAYMLLLIAAFVPYMGQQELAAVRYRERMRHEEPLEVLPADVDVINADALPARPNFSGFTWDSNRRMWVEWRDGRPVHTITVQSD